jgi:hypothetical protein
VACGEAQSDPRSRLTRFRPERAAGSNCDMGNRAFESGRTCPADADRAGTVQRMHVVWWMFVLVGGRSHRLNPLFPKNASCRFSRSRVPPARRETTTHPPQNARTDRSCPRFAHCRAREGICRQRQSERLHKAESTGRPLLTAARAIAFDERAVNFRCRLMAEVPRTTSGQGRQCSLVP